MLATAIGKCGSEYGAVAAQQGHDGVQRFIHAAALGGRVDAQHIGVRHQRARPAAEHRPAPCHVVELHEALRHQERVVVGQGGDPRAKPDGAGALGSGGDDELGRGDDLPPGGVMFADPRLVIAEAVEKLDHLQVARDG